MKKISFVFFILIAGCGSQDNLELEIVTKSLNCKDVGLSQCPKYMKMDTLAVKDSRTVVTYKLTNNTKKTYYFNLDDYDEYLHYSFINLNNACLAIYDSNGNYQKPHVSSPSGGFDRGQIHSEYLGYQYRGRLHATNSNFIIHPNETLYFEWFVVLPFGNLSEDLNYSVVLNPKKKYYANILVHSDTTNYKLSLSRTDLKTIEDNGYEIYRGTITSKNKIPIIFR